MTTQRTFQYRGKVRPNTSKDPLMILVVHLMLMSKVPIRVQARWGKCEPTTLRSWIKGKTKAPDRIAVENVLKGHGYSMPIVDTKTGQTVRQPNVPVWETVGWVDYSKLHGRKR